jgi:hypothetical protein
MKGYAFELQGHGTFTPNGRADEITDVRRHNAEVERAKLATWAEKPERFQVYIQPCSGDGCPEHGSGQQWRQDRNPMHKGARVTTWLGTELGKVIRVSTYTNNFGARITAVTIRGNNGATYHGRYGADWAGVCRVSKSKGGR